MKLNMKRLGAFAASLLMLVACAFGAQNVRADESTPKTTTFFSVVFPSVDALWNGAEALGAEMKYLETIQGLRELTKNGKLQFLDFSKPVEFNVASDGNDVFVYTRFPLRSTLDEAQIAALKDEAAGKQQALDEIFVEGSSLYACRSQYKSLVPTDAPEPTIEDKDAILVIDANIGAIPREMIEAGFAAFRQQLAANAGNSEVSLEDLEGVLEFYSEIIDSLDRSSITTRVDADHNLVTTFSVVAKPNSELSGLLEKTRDAKTRWNVVANTPNAIFAGAGSQVQTDAIKKFQKNQLENVTYRNLLNQLDVLIDAPEDFEVAKQLVETFKNEALACIESGNSDVGIAFKADPVLFDFAWTLCKSEEFSKALRLLVEHMIKNNPDVAKYVALETKTVEGYKVSELNLPYDGLTDDPAEYFIGKVFTARLGIDDSSAIFVFGLNVADVDAEFARIAKGSKEIGAVPTGAYLDFAQLAQLLYDFVSSEGSARPVAVKTLETISAGQGVRWTSNQRFSENRVDVDLVVEKGFFKVLGDVIRLNIAAVISGDKDADEGEDLDDLFDEEE